MRRGAEPCESGRSKPSLVVMSGTERTNSIPLALISAMILLPRRKPSGVRMSALTPCCICGPLPQRFGPDVGAIASSGQTGSRVGKGAVVHRCHFGEAVARLCPRGPAAERSTAWAKSPARHVFVVHPRRRFCPPHPTFPRLLDANVGVRDDGRPFPALGRKKPRQVLRRAHAWLNAELCKPGLKLSSSHAFVDDRVEPRHDRCGSAGGCDHALEARQHEA